MNKLSGNNFSVLAANQRLSDPIKQLMSEEARLVFLDNHITRAVVVGSFARGEAREDSDIDLMIRVQEGAIFTLFNIGAVMSDLLGVTGRKIDLVEEDAIRSRIKPFIMAHQIEVFNV